MRDREAIYDEQINPLMARIIAICKEHDIPFVATFQLTDGLDEDGQLTDPGVMCCTSTNVPEWSDEKLVDVLQHRHQGCGGGVAARHAQGGAGAGAGEDRAMSTPAQQVAAMEALGAALETLREALEEVDRGGSGYDVVRPAWDVVHACDDLLGGEDRAEERGDS